MTTFADTYEARGMSRRYGEVIDQLSERFRNQLEGRAPVLITDADHARGCDALPDTLKQLTTEAFDDYLRDGYEVSYNQMCIAFFTAVDQSWQLLEN